MHRMFGVALLVGCSLALSGCNAFWAPVIPPVGGMFNKTTMPTNLALDGVEIGSRRGESSTIAILGLISFGQSGTQTAARNGGLTEITHVDAEYTNILYGVFQEYKTITYGH